MSDDEIKLIGEFDKYASLIGVGHDIDKHLDWLVWSNQSGFQEATIKARHRKLKKLVQALYEAVVE
jgi:hypothetical protein